MAPEDKHKLCPGKWPKKLAPKSRIKMSKELNGITDQKLRQDKQLQKGSLVAHTALVSGISCMGPWSEAKARDSVRCGCSICSCLILCQIPYVEPRLAAHSEALENPGPEYQVPENYGVSSLLEDRSKHSQAETFHPK